MRVHRLMYVSGALLMMAATAAVAQVPERRSGSGLDVLRRTIEQAEAERAAEESRRAAERAQPRRDVPTRNERDEPYRRGQSEVTYDVYEDRGRGRHDDRGRGRYDDRYDDWYDSRGASLSELFRGIRLDRRQEREVDAIARGYGHDVQRLRVYHRRRGELGSRQHRHAEDRLEWRYHNDLRSVLDSRQRRTFDRNLSRAGYDPRWDDRRW